MANFADRFLAKNASAPAEGDLTPDQQVLLAEFEKAASANGIDISELSEEDVGELFQEFLADLEGADDEPADKIAAAQNLIVLREFEKAAAAVDLDLSALSEAQVQEAFMHWLNGSVEDIAQEDETKVASAKLAEVEVLGNHMADVFLGRVNAGLSKEAELPTRGDMSEAWKAARGAGVSRTRAALEIGTDAARIAGSHAGSAIRANKGKAGLAGAAALGVGGMYARSKRKEKTASAIEALVEISRIKNGQ
jgi:hypothetical protein